MAGFAFEEAKRSPCGGRSSAKPAEPCHCHGCRHEADHRSAGTPLDAATHEDMRRRFGHDFSQVRIHSDGEAARRVGAMGAIATASGNDVSFAAGRYQPSRPAGRLLLAHELAHVVQQSRGAGSAPGPAAERDADVAASHAVAGLPASPRQSAPAGWRQRQDHEASFDPATLSDRALLRAFERAVVSAAPLQAPYRSALQAEVRRRFRVVAEQGAPPASGGGQMVNLGDVAGTGGTVVAFVAPAGPGAEVIAGEVAGEALAGATTTTTTTTAAAAEGAGAAEGLGILSATGAFFLFVLTMPFWLAGDTPAPRTQPQPQPQPQPRPQTRTQTQPQPQTRPRVTADVDIDEDRRRGCHGRAIAQRGGNTCHDQFAQLISGVGREWGVTTPEGMFASYDALGRDGMLYEIKTGYRFLLGNNPQTATLRQQTLERFLDQSSRQLAVATRCGYPLVWMFNDAQVAAAVESLIEPRVGSRPFPCDLDR